MAKKKVVRKPKGPPIAWSHRVTENVGYCCFLVAEELRKYCENPNQEAVHAMVAYATVLRSIFQRHPIWPRHSEFERWELLNWCERIRRDLDVAAKPVPASCREEFKAAVNADLDFLIEFMDRKKDPANDANMK